MEPKIAATLLDALEVLCAPDEPLLPYPDAYRKGYAMGAICCALREAGVEIPAHLLEKIP